MISFITATALQCTPVDFAWTRWDGEHPGKCFNLNVEAWMSAGINIVLDLIVISLPLRDVKNLKMGLRRKFGVMFMFLGGGL
jgi:DMSO/TMAO reductase YedYZ heme-binding membrane subunit